MNTIGVAILGGSGFGGGELLRLLAQHPMAEVVAVGSTSSAGRPIAEAHPHLAGFYEECFVPSIDLASLAGYPRSVVISALPSGDSCRAIEAIAPACLDQGTKIIDLSGDFRLTDPRLHERFYPGSAVGRSLAPRFAYGLPELNRREIADAALVANPGCHATACILSVAPIKDAAAGGIVFDSKTGSSGSGRIPKVTTLHANRHGNLFAYKPLEHQHEPEIAQALGLPHDGEKACSFVPHSLPLSRGVFVTAYLRLERETSSEALRETYESFYKDCDFVRVRTASPELQNVVGSNFCDVYVVARGRQVVCMAALDNLIKGMAGQAIQNMNIMCGLPETEGLWQPAMRPL
jgi:N-acetyl-gamma-glutamyl-phosphate/LysW-gamma-L-alpha-aminoadipyl-6-phosphate reductase